MENIPGPSRILSRSEGITDLSNQYSLRPKPTSVQKYGVSSPVKSLKKTIYKNKNKSNTKK